MRKIFCLCLLNSIIFFNSCLLNPLFIEYIFPETDKSINPFLFLALGGTEIGSDSFALGGSISGLTHSGLVLSSGTASPESLTVSSGASAFQFTNKINPESTYNISITNQPSGNVCTISNNTGTMNGNVSSVSIICETITTLYVLNTQAQIIRAMTVSSNGSLSLLNTYSTGISAGFMLWNGKHIVIGGGSDVKSYLRNPDGTITSSNSLTLTNALDGGSQYFEPSGKFFYAHSSSNFFSKIQIDTDGLLSAETSYGSGCYLVVGPVHPASNNVWTFNTGCGQAQGYFPIANTTTGALGGGVANGTNITATPFFPEACSNCCSYSHNGNYLYCADGGDVPGSKSGGDIKQMSVTSTALTSLSPFNIAPETPTHYLGPKSLILHPNGNYIFVYGNSNIFSYNLSSTTGLIGTLVNSLPAPNSCSTSSNIGTNLQINADGTILYAICTITGDVGVYSISSNGVIGTPSIYATAASSGTQQLIYVKGN
ncbi:hypothetical protein [Leptospira ilyithenensis]|uniref:Lactonase n=1 Tax=Leptospira ilyithenensis TaxID=2484901 RepID=A0A4R9LSL2_9LEPT|nr:hypothetical protein [Leptospira ilyithenensis]TGN10404.1 hypothetical protein EHS11_08895 [Leptospira ilyithenensis]